MPVPKSTIFTSWEFVNDQELAVATILTELNYKFIQNELSIRAQQKMLLKPDPESGNSQRNFELEHMYLQGAMEALQFILTSSDNMKTEMQRELEDAASTKPKSTNTEF